MKEDVGMSNPKKHVNKVGKLACEQGWEANIGPKIKQTTSI